MKEWIIKELGEIAKVQTGPFGSQLLNEQYIIGGTPIITVEHIKNFEIAKLDYPSVSVEDRERLKKYSLKEGDIVFSRVGSVDLSAITRNENEGWLFSSRMLRVRPDFEIIDPYFLSYYFRLFGVRRYINNVAVGSTMPSINTSILKTIPVRYPKKEQQIKIAKVLTVIDKKINLLREQNETLEQFAQTLFKRWFLYFEFPNEKGKPYKSSGGKMMHSELGEIPQGWSVKSIGNLTVQISDYVANGSFASLKENVQLYPDKEEFALFIRNTDLKSGFREKVFVDEHSYNFLKKTKLFGGELIISNVGDVGSVYLCPFIECPMTLGNNVIMLKSNFNYFLFLFFKGRIGQFLLKGITGGSAQPKFNKTDFKTLILPMPGNNILHIFEAKAAALFKKISQNESSIATLSKLKNTLLPKLMSGELTVKETAKL